MHLATDVASHPSTHAPRKVSGAVEEIVGRLGRSQALVGPTTMKNHAIVFVGGLAAVVLLLGIAFGAASQQRKAPPPSASEAG
jgi:hypothetical protein